VNANRAPENSELADMLDRLGSPEAVTISEIVRIAGGEADKSEFTYWLQDRKNSRLIPHRMEECGYVAVRNKDRTDHLWSIMGARKVIYAKSALTIHDQHIAARALVANNGKVIKEDAPLDPDIPF
jgi:hypothetical protein